MAYPDLPTAAGSDPEPLAMTKLDRAEDGSARGRALGADKMSFKLEHYVSAAQKATLDAFYVANRLLEFSYTSDSDGNTYTCLFAARPKYERLSPGLWRATVELEEA